MGVPAPISRFKPATRTMKNSSRFELTIARNFTRFEQGGTVQVERLLENAVVELGARRARG